VAPTGIYPNKKIPAPNNKPLIETLRANLISLNGRDAIPHHREQDGQQTANEQSVSRNGSGQKNLSYTLKWHLHSVTKTAE
jgi:hypothetical protein